MDHYCTKERYYLRIKVHCHLKGWCATVVAQKYSSCVDEVFWTNHTRRCSSHDLMLLCTLSESGLPSLAVVFCTVQHDFMLTSPLTGSSRCTRERRQMRHISSSHVKQIRKNYHSKHVERFYPQILWYIM